MKPNDDLVSYLSCEFRRGCEFIGLSKDFGLATRRIYGGQVFGQAINAALQTVSDDRPVHSAHGYFLCMGDNKKPVSYAVQSVRDGRSFSFRRVSAFQGDREIFNLNVSFHVPEEGLEFNYQQALPLNVLERIAVDFPRNNGVFQSELVDIYVLTGKERTRLNAYQMWMRSRYPLPDTENFHRVVVAYMSDVGMISSMAVPHESELPLLTNSSLGNYFSASLDHSIRFHRPCKADDWLFFDCQVETTSAGRGFSLGKVFGRDGVLVASISQEGVFRVASA